MKKSNIYFFTCCSLALLLFSCSKWTDVDPRTEIRHEQVFSSEASVQEALNSVYGGMATADAYGREMTWALVDAMGGVYDAAMLKDYEVQALSGQFNNAATQTIIENAYVAVYRSIANANNLIAGINNADSSIFKNNNQRLFRGEAIGLRAMLHFDILRLFGPTVNANTWNSPILPYVTEYGSNVTPRISGPEFIQKILADLREAETLLELDPIRETADVEALRARKVRFNYFAVKAVQARVHMLMNDREEALQAANAVMAAVPSKFSWTTASQIQGGSSGSSYDFILSSQNVFSLYVSNLEQFTEGQLANIPLENTTIARYVPHYRITDAQRQSIYEAATVGATDYRNTYMISLQTNATLSTLLFRKLHQSVASVGTIYARVRPLVYAANRIPLIKTVEMFYIAAECLAEQQPTEAVALLNQVRTNRGIGSNLPTTLTPEQVREEIKKEYLKEFPCEGQIFFFRKRTGETNAAWPLPQHELDYGF